MRKEWIKIVCLGLLILLAVFIAGCSSVCVPVKVDRVYYHPEIRECTVIINDTPYGLRSEKQCAKIKTGEVNMISFETTESAFQGISYVCGGS